MFVGLLAWLAQLVAALAIALNAMASGHVAGAFTDTVPPPIEPVIVATNPSVPDPELPAPLPEPTPEPEPIPDPPKWKKWCRYMDNFQQPSDNLTCPCYQWPSQDEIISCRYPSDY